MDQLVATGTIDCHHWDYKNLLLIIINHKIIAVGTTIAHKIIAMGTTIATKVSYLEDTTILLFGEEKKNISILVMFALQTIIIDLVTITTKHIVNTIDVLVTFLAVDVGV